MCRRLLVLNRDTSSSYGGAVASAAGRHPIRYPGGRPISNGIMCTPSNVPSLGHRSER
jgi:hypothetical protein